MLRRIENLLKMIKKIYQSIHFNLGIKTFLEKCWSFFVLKTGLERLYNQTKKKVDKFINYSKIKLKMWVEKKIVFPLYNKISSYLYTRLVYHYGADYRWDDQKSQNLDKNKQNLGYGLIHYAMIRNQRPKRILCIGSMYGFIPFMLAKACDDNEYGEVDFVDAGYDMADEVDKDRHNFGLGFWKKVDVEEHFNYLLDSSRINFHLIKSQDFAKQTKYKYDYIYVDGGHWYEQAKLDFDLFWPKLREEGFIVYHDIHHQVVSKGIPFEYWRLWDELSEKYDFKFELSNHYSGLGFIQKITKPREKFQHVFK